MKLYQLHAKQAVPISKEEAWEFLSNPKNLEKITPESMGFQIRDGADKPMFAGQIIQYKVSPFPGFSTKWVSEITQVQKPDYFVDVQLFGPYALWHHKHFITEIDGGVLLEDIVDYKLPLGFLGQIAHPLLVKKQLLTIFKHRENALIERFGTIPNQETTVLLKDF